MDHSQLSRKTQHRAQPTLLVTQPPATPLTAAPDLTLVTQSGTNLARRTEPPCGISGQADLAKVLRDIRQCLLLEAAYD
ncbi:hypothetical protein [Levilactobacillus koreensis]|uniref:Uncharacterized protein n=1 Tax=Levilactobacillus koreensis TaxID=637971 RepID=A0AAC8UTU3_9LACO|nr:hypothetical protein [Levilactobacillus koreensis]AKP64266.1 hypothetical protein ABN16_04155 [Levilactobacillus koreensis]